MHSQNLSPTTLRQKAVRKIRQSKDSAPADDDRSPVLIASGREPTAAKTPTKTPPCLRNESHDGLPPVSPGGPQTFLVTRRRLDPISSEEWQHPNHLPFMEYMLLDFSDRCALYCNHGVVVGRIAFEDLPAGAVKYLGRSSDTGGFIVRRRTQLMDVCVMLAWQPIEGFRVETQRAQAIFGHDIENNDSVKTAYSALSRFAGILRTTCTMLSMRREVLSSGSYNGKNAAYGVAWRSDAPALVVRTIPMGEVDLIQWRRELAL